MIMITQSEHLSAGQAVLTAHIPIPEMGSESSLVAKIIPKSNQKVLDDDVNDLKKS